ncbi:MAG: type II secretion system protein [Chitinivibrionales bacterium]|nr:type II secretion system protein [Chitinivibrionales bacterium]
MKMNRNGFTLLEMMIGLFIIFVCSTVFLQFNQKTNQSKSDQEFLSIAVNLAQSRIEEFKLKGRNQPDKDTTENPVANFTQFSRRTRVTQNAVNPSLTRVTVTVLWKNNQRSYVVETLL